MPFRAPPEEGLFAMTMPASCPRSTTGQPLDCACCALLAALGVLAARPATLDAAISEARTTNEPLWCPVPDVLANALVAAARRGWIRATDRERDGGEPLYALTDGGRAAFEALMERPVPECRTLSDIGIALKTSLLGHLPPPRRAGILNELHGELSRKRQGFGGAPSGYARSREAARIDFDLAWIDRLRRQLAEEGTERT